MWFVLKEASVKFAPANLVTKDADGTRVCSERQGQSALVRGRRPIERRAAERISQSARCEPRPRSRDTIFFSLSASRVAAWASSAFSLLSPFFSPVRVAFVSSGPRKRTSSFSRENRLICASLIYASSSLLPNGYLRASFIIQPDRTKCFPWWMISCQRAPK